MLAEFVYMEADFTSLVPIFDVSLTNFKITQDGHTLCDDCQRLSSMEYTSLPVINGSPMNLERRIIRFKFRLSDE